MAVNGVREEGKDGTPAHMTPREIGKRGPDQLFHPWSVCTVCTGEETACSDGEMAPAC